MGRANGAEVFIGREWSENRDGDLWQGVVTGTEEGAECDDVGQPVLIEIDGVSWSDSAAPGALDRILASPSEPPPTPNKKPARRPCKG